MNPIQVFVEAGKKKTFAGAVDWPGWCRGGRDEAGALQALVDYGPRYARVLHGRGLGGRGLEFQVPSGGADLVVVERQEGNSTTDFGAPAIVLDGDRAAVDGSEYGRWREILPACWEAFDGAVGQAGGRELRKGPRGGGRDVAKMVDHVLEADRAYLARLNWKHKREAGRGLAEELERTRQAIVGALEVAERGELPERGARGGLIWPPRYFVRRVAWHVLDHAWEIEDRIV
jgi:hypothetical protein